MTTCRSFRLIPASADCYRDAQEATPLPGRPEPLKGFRLKKLVQAAIASAGAALFLLLATLILLGEEASNARAEANAVTFPPVEEFEHYTTVGRGVSTEHMMTSREALAALKAGTTVAVGTHMVLVDYREGKVFRYFVSQKMGRVPTNGRSNGFIPTARSRSMRIPRGATRAIAPVRTVSSCSRCPKRRRSDREQMRRRASSGVFRASTGSRRRDGGASPSRSRLLVARQSAA